jgi:hypothetical protein
MPLYRINPGRTVRMEDGTVKTGGEVIDLGDDIAAANPGVAERLPDDEQPHADDHQAAA